MSARNAAHIPAMDNAKLSDAEMEALLQDLGLDAPADALAVLQANSTFAIVAADPVLRARLLQLLTAGTSSARGSSASHSSGNNRSGTEDSDGGDDGGGTVDSDGGDDGGGTEDSNGGGTEDSDGGGAEDSDGSGAEGSDGSGGNSSDDAAGPSDASSDGGDSAESRRSPTHSELMSDSDLEDVLGNSCMEEGEEHELRRAWHNPQVKVARLAHDLAMEAAETTAESADWDELHQFDGPTGRNDPHWLNYVRSKSEWLPPEPLVTVPGISARERVRKLPFRIWDYYTDAHDETVFERLSTSGALLSETLEEPEEEAAGYAEYYPALRALAEERGLDPLCPALAPPGGLDSDSELADPADARDAVEALEAALDEADGAEETDAYQANRALMAMRVRNELAATLESELDDLDALAEQDVQAGAEVLQRLKSQFSLASAPDDEYGDELAASIEAVLAAARQTGHPSDYADRVAAQFRNDSDQIVQARPDLKRRREEEDALAEIRCEQAETGLILPAKAIKRLAEEIICSMKMDWCAENKYMYNPTMNPFFESDALEALQTAAEAHLIGLFQDAVQVACHAGRDGVTVADLNLVRKLRTGCTGVAPRTVA